MHFVSKPFSQVGDWEACGQPDTKRMGLIQKAKLNLHHHSIENNEGDLPFLVLQPSLIQIYQKNTCPTSSVLRSGPTPVFFGFIDFETFIINSINPKNSQKY